MGNKYRKNYLTQVIARIDFLSPLSSLQEALPAAVGEVSTRFFPIPEPKEIVGREFWISSETKQVNEKDIITKEWHFFGKRREKRLVITREFMFVEFKVYESFDDFRTHFIGISDGLFGTFDDLQVKRLGLRYINNIEVPGPNKFSWNAYLNRNLLSILNIPADKAKIARAFNNLDLNLGDFTLRFQYGMHNPDYPAPIRKKIFVLDYDAYTTGLLTKEEIHQTLPILHDEIEQLFEKSITDKLRGIMDVERQR